MNYNTIRKEWDERIVSALSPARLLDEAIRLIAIPSPTGGAGELAEDVAVRLSGEGFRVERFVGGHKSAPAVLARWDSGKPGPIVQFAGHLDTVHLPFVGPEVKNGYLWGRGAADMKAGVAAMIEAARILRDLQALETGAVVLALYDLHEAPWGDGRQWDAILDAGLGGDFILLAEPLHDHLPVAGRGSAVWSVELSREQPPVHEVMRPPGTPDVIAAAADLVLSLDRYRSELAQSQTRDSIAGIESVFIGSIHSGEIFNQSPALAVVEGTRRWLSSRDPDQVETDFLARIAAVAERHKVAHQCRYRKIRGAYELNLDDPKVQVFRNVYHDVTGNPLPLGPKAFVDDGNSVSARWGRRIPAITHGPKAGGQHTMEEWVELRDLERVARIYALTASILCSAAADGLCT